jgi:hypothetical protein
MEKFCSSKQKKGKGGWCMPRTPATQKMEIDIGKVRVQGQPGQKVSKNHLN